MSFQQVAFVEDGFCSRLDVEVRRWIGGVFVVGCGAIAGTIVAASAPAAVRLCVDHQCGGPFAFRRFGDVELGSGVGRVEQVVVSFVLGGGGAYCRRPLWSFPEAVCEACGRTARGLWPVLAGCADFSCSQQQSSFVLLVEFEVDPWVSG